MDKTKGEGGSRGGRWIWLGWSRGVGEKNPQKPQIYVPLNTSAFQHPSSSQVSICGSALLALFLPFLLNTTPLLPSLAVPGQPRLTTTLDQASYLLGVSTC